MSKGFGSIQRKVIAYLEENPDSRRMDLVIAIAGHEYSKSDKSKIYRAIRVLLEDMEVIQFSPMKSLRTTLDPYFRANVKPKPKMLRINPNSERYIQYKQKK